MSENQSVLKRDESGVMIIDETAPQIQLLEKIIEEGAKLATMKNGIVKGYSPNTFGPDDPVTREQMVTILHRYALWKGVPDTGGASLSGFPDGAAVASWSASSMSWAVERGVIFGTKRGNEVLLDPRGMTTRAQAAAIFHRAAPLITAEKQLKGR